MIRILTEPRNALVKQYQRLFELDRVALHFQEDALKAIAQQAIQRKTGARGLRAIIEKVLLDTMFELPSNSEVRRCIVTREVIEEGAKPELIKEVAALPQKTRRQPAPDRLAGDAS